MKLTDEMCQSFVGPWTAECIASHRDCAAGKSDLPCWRVTGPGDLEAIVWGAKLWGEREAINAALELLAPDLQIVGHETIHFVDAGRRALEGGER